MAELEVTLLFLQWEEDHWFYRWERMLGLVWTPEDLEGLAKPPTEVEDNSLTSAEPRLLRYPLSLLVRPELLQNLKDHAMPSGGLFGMDHVPNDASSLFRSSKEEFLRRLGATPLGPDSDIANRPDPYSNSRRPAGGFSEGTPRSFGGHRK